MEIQEYLQLNSINQESGQTDQGDQPGGLQERGGGHRVLSPIPHPRSPPQLTPKIGEGGRAAV